MKVSLDSIKSMGSEFRYTTLGSTTKVNGRMAIRTEKDYCNLAMEALSKEIFRTTTSTDMLSTIGQGRRDTKESGSSTKLKDLE